MEGTKQMVISLSFSSLPLILSSHLMATSSDLVDYSSNTTFAGLNIY